MVGRRVSIKVMSAAWRLLLALCVSFCLIEMTPAQEQKMYDIDLPAQSVVDALNGLSQQTGVPVVFPFDLAKNRMSHPVIGRYALLDALNALLENTGLSGGLSDKGVLTISATRSRADKQGDAQVMQTENGQAKPRAPRAAGIAAFFASLAVGFTSSAQPSATAEPPSDTTKLSEVIVTAQKKQERLQDVPIPVSVLDTNQLAANNQTRLMDYFDQVPGLTAYASSSNFGLTPSLSIRGVAPVGGGPTIGIVIDDIPCTGSCGSGLRLLSPTQAA